MYSFTTSEKGRVKMMVRFELKKVLGKTSSKITLLILAGIVAITCYLAISVEWVNEQGNHETGYAAVVKLRNARKEWAGPLDEEKLTQVILENQRIEATPEAQSKDIQQSNIAFGWKQGFYDIRWLLCYAYADGFRNLDYYTADRIGPEAASQFYPNRIRLLKEWLYDETGEAYSLFTDAEKQWLVQQYEDLETPLYYDYLEGWDRLLYYCPQIIGLSTLIMAYLVAGIFANEFRWKSDAVYFSTVHGRKKATAAKIKAAFVLVTALYWASILICSLFVLCYLGFDGANCPIQILNWKCFYNITIWQYYLLVVLGGYLGSLFFAFLTMWVSAKTKSTVFAVTVPFLLYFLPSFLSNLNHAAIDKVLALLPDRLLLLDDAVLYFDVYEIGKTVSGAVPILIGIYCILTAVLIPMMYREFRRKQIT